MAKLQQVNIAGVTVQHASLHNTNFVQTLDLRVGDTVIVERRGDVIPQIAEVLYKKRPRKSAPWTPPSECPACNSRLELRTPNDGSKAAAKGVPVLACNNADCVGRHGRLLKHFAAVCIKGVGKRMVEDFAEKGLVATPVDFYSLHEKRAQVLHAFHCFDDDDAGHCAVAMLNA